MPEEQTDLKKLLQVMVDVYVPFLEEFIERNPDYNYISRLEKTKKLFKLHHSCFKTKPEKPNIEQIREAEKAIKRLKERFDAGKDGSPKKLEKKEETAKLQNSPKNIKQVISISDTKKNKSSPSSKYNPSILNHQHATISPSTSKACDLINLNKESQKNYTKNNATKDTEPRNNTQKNPDKATNIESQKITSKKDTPKDTEPRNNTEKNPDKATNKESQKISSKKDTTKDTQHRNNAQKNPDKATNIESQKITSKKDTTKDTEPINNAQKNPDKAADIEQNIETSTENIKHKWSRFLSQYQDGFFVWLKDQLHQEDNERKKLGLRQFLQNNEVPTQGETSSKMQQNNSHQEKRPKRNFRGCAKPRCQKTPEELAEYEILHPSDKWSNVNSISNGLIVIKTEPAEVKQEIIEKEIVEEDADTMPGSNARDERGPTSFTGLFSKPPKIADIPILPEVIETNIPHIENPVSPLANDVENKPMPATIAQLCRKANKSLRPWITNEIESNALKTFVCCKKMLEPIPLEDYFKCMASACFFTTSKLGEIEEHIESHLGAPGSLHCAYCSLVAEDSIELTSHIASEHKMDVYHCRYCFYRCCMVGHQVEHLKKYHPDEEPLYICEQEANQGKPPTKEPYEMRDVQKARQMFVPPLVCKVCMKGNYLMKPFLNHLNTKHHKDNKVICHECEETVDSNNMEEHLIVHNIGFHQCLFCKFGCKEVATMREHLAESHPNELSVVCIRKPKVKKFQHEKVYPAFIESTVFEDIGISTSQIPRITFQEMQDNKFVKDLNRMMGSETHFLESMQYPPDIDITENDGLY